MRQLIRKSCAFATQTARFSVPFQRLYSCNTHLSNYLHISKEVKHALEAKQPVVALESTIITHGMPYPENARTALAVEDIIRSKGVVPATVAVIDGKVNIGLDENKLEHLAQNGHKSIKTSRRDLSYVISQGLTGGTTVAGTMLAAHMAGIPTFVTGGLGGVHRGAAESFDVSADLTELGRTPVAVVCSGVKSILDIGLTLEYLETEGVPVVSYGKSKEFPAFFTRHSGFEAPYCLDNANDVARMIASNHSLGLKCGMIVAVPIPEDDVHHGEEIESCIQRALEDARINGITGKDVTPYVLAKVNEMSRGKSLTANISLVKNNARIGADIAVELAKLSYKSETKNSDFQIRVAVKEDSSNLINDAPKSRPRRPVVIGGCNFDLLSKTSTYDVLGEATNKGKLFQGFGGVARNVADCLARLGSDPLLISAVGSDTSGQMILNDFQRHNLDTRGIMVSSEMTTACYSLIVNVAGDLILGVGDMDIHDTITPDYISEFEEDILNASIVCCDGNLSPEAIDSILALCSREKVPVWFEPTDVEKSRKPFKSKHWDTITFVSPNRNELRTMYAAVENRQIAHSSYADESEVNQTESDLIMECAKLSLPILEKIPVLFVTLGKFGVLVGTRGRLDGIANVLKTIQSNKEIEEETLKTPRFYHYPAVSAEHGPIKVASVSGAGDSFAGAMMHGLLTNRDVDLSIKYGLYAAYLSLQTHSTISEQLISAHLNDKLIQSFFSWSPQEITL